MDFVSESEASSRSHSYSSSVSDFDTPLTERSTLFGYSTPDLLPGDRQFIAVVGGLGYIGSHTCLELIKTGYNIIIIDNLSNSYQTVYDRLHTLANRHYSARCEPVPEMRFYEADYRDAATMTKILADYVEVQKALDRGRQHNEVSSKIKGVIHFGAFKSVSESIQEPLRYYANNVAGLIEFCSLLSRFNIKTFVFSSSATVYGSIANSGKPLREEYCTHESEAFIDHDGDIRTVDGGCTGLTNPYGRTKWMCEAILSDLALADPQWTIVALRYFNPVGCDESGLLGEDPKGIPTNLMPVVVKVLLHDSPVLDVFGTDYPTHDGTAIRDFIHVTDLARGHLAALAAASDGRVPHGFRTYNLGSGKGHSVMDVVHAIEAVSSTKIPTRVVERREGDVGICVAAPTRAELELNWRTEKTLEMCCRDIFNFLELNKSSTLVMG